MNSLQKEVPKWTWYNLQLLFQFQERLESSPDTSLQNFFSDFLRDQKLINGIYHAKNQGTAILALYGLLVVPKEILGTNEEIEFSFRTRKYFSGLDEKLETGEFLRLLRNSLAHANFSLELESEVFKFWNINKKNVVTLEVYINYVNLGKFIKEIGLYYVNIALEDI